MRRFIASAATALALAGYALAGNRLRHKRWGDRNALRLRPVENGHGKRMARTAL